MLLADWNWLIWNTPTWRVSEVWAAGILLLPSVIAIVAGKIVHKPLNFIPHLITGQDGKWSTSKAAVLLWTYVILFAGLSTVIERNNTGAFFDNLKPEYLVVLGIPAGAAFGAKVIASQGDGSSTSDAGPQTNVLNGLGQLVGGDDDTALHKFQYLTFNLLLIAFFLVKFLGAETEGLPDLPDTFVGLTGVSAAAYLAQKGLGADGQSGATIRSVVPQEAPPGQPITIFGVNLATPAWPTVRVLVGSLEAPAPTVAVSDQVTTVKTSVPPALKPGPTTVK